jgi:hypothetical protein
VTIWRRWQGVSLWGEDWLLERKHNEGRTSQVTGEGQKGKACVEQNWKIRKEIKSKYL